MKKLKQTEPIVSCLHTLRRVGNEEYISCLHVLYDISVGDQPGGVWDSRAVYRMRAGLEDQIRQGLGEKLFEWEQDLKNIVEEGIVFMQSPEPPAREGTCKYLPGRLERREGQLMWVQVLGEKDAPFNNGLIAQLLAAYAAAVSAAGSNDLQSAMLVAGPDA